MSAAKIAIVTGAGSGIGRETARLLADAGYSVVLVGRTRSKLEQTAKMIGDQASCLALPTDLCDAGATRAIVDKTVKHFGGLDAIANIAGHAQVCSIDQITADEWRKTIDANLTAVMMLTSAAWPVFTRQHSGVIVNVSSMASIDPFPGFAMYAPAKAALNMFTRITASEGKSIGLRAVAIAPGAVETPMLRAFFDQKMIPQNKTLSPRAIAQVVCDCITGVRTFEPGAVIPMPSPQ